MEIAGLEVYRPGYGWLPLAEGDRLTLADGDTLRVSITTQYKGPGKDFTLYGAVGTRVGVLIEEFDEALVGTAVLSCPESASFTPVSGSVDIPIVVDPDAVSAPFVGYAGALPPGTDYDLYVKVKEHPSVRDEVDDIIDLSAPSSIFSLIGPLLLIGLMAGMASMMTPMAEEEKVKEVD